MGWLFNWTSKLSSREKRIFYFAILLVCLFILDRTVVQNVSTKISTINSDIDQILKKIKDNQIYLDKKNSQLITEEYKKYMSYLSSTQPKSATELSKLVEEIAAKNSITIDKIGATATRESSKQITLQVDCWGDKIKIITFLYQLSTSSVFLTIEKIVLSPKKEDFVANIILSHASLQTE